MILCVCMKCRVSLMCCRCVYSIQFVCRVCTRAVLFPSRAAAGPSNKGNKLGETTPPLSETADVNRVVDVDILGFVDGTV